MAHNSVRPAKVLQSAGIFAASVIGAGFATGQEIVQFFSAHGSMSIAGSIITALVFSYCGAMFMSHGYRYNLESHKSTIDFYFGKCAKAVDAVIEVFVYSIFVVLIAGVGALSNECLGIPVSAGRIISGAIILVLVLTGTDRLSLVIGILGITVIVFTFTAGLYGAFTGTETLYTADYYVSSTKLLKSPGPWYWSGILYPCFNAIFMLFLSVHCGSTSSLRAEAILGGLLGGILLGAGIGVMNIGFLKNISETANVSIPSLVLASKIGRPMRILFSALIFAGICTCASPMLLNVIKSVVCESSHSKFIMTATILSVLAQILAAADFRILVNTLYPFSGYAGIVFILWCTLRGIMARRKKS